MAQGIFATPNIGNAGGEVAQVQPDAVNTAGIPTTAQLATASAVPVLEGVQQGAGFVESRQLKSQAQDLSAQIQKGFQNDAASQSAASSLGAMKQALSQGQLSASSMLIRAKALQDKAKGLSPIYAAEIDEVFAKNGIDPNGRNGLGTMKADYELEDMKDKIKTVSAWHRDPNMSQYIVYQPGLDHTEDNIDVSASLDNVAKVNDTLRATEQGLSSTLNSTLATIDSQMSNKLSQLQQATGNPAEIASQQQAVVSQFRNQINQLLSYSAQNLAKFPPGSDQYKNITSQISAIRSFKNDLETMTPQQLLAAKTNADMVGAQLATVTGNYQISYYESGLKSLEDLSRINANGLTVFDNSKIQIIQDKINNGAPLDPTEQSLYNFSKSPATYINFLNTNGQKKSYSQMDDAAPQLLAQTDSQALSSFMSGAYNKFTDQKQMQQAKENLAFNASRLFDGVANTGMFIKAPENYVNILKQTSNNTGINTLLDTLPTSERNITAQNVIKAANTAMTASGMPFSLPSLRSMGAKVIIDNRTGTIRFQGSSRLRESNALNSVGVTELNAVSSSNLFGTSVNSSIPLGNQVWNNGLQTMVNLSSYDPNLKDKSKGEIALQLLQQQGYPEDLIEVKD